MVKRMNRVRCMKTALLLFVVVAFVGCKSRQETPGANPSAPLKNAGSEIKSISGQIAGGAIVTPPQDKADAQATAKRVLAQMEAGDFFTIYNEAAPGFRQIGKEADFISKFQQTRQKTGPLNNPKEISFVTRPDKAYVLVYRLQNERFISERRLTFFRSKSGKMELLGLNQHDESRQATQQ